MADTHLSGTPATTSLPEEGFIDVWSRTSKKHRLRAGLLLLLNVILFACLGLFAYWIRSGEYFLPGSGHYWDVFWQTFTPTGEKRVTLNNLLQYPISVDQVPLQVVILGLLLAALVSIPILVSILYRFPASLLFAAIVSFIALMPWLGLTLVASCALASLRPFRFRFRYASAMMGLLPIVIYFFTASRESSATMNVTEGPLDQIKYIAPWLIAFVASCLLMAIVLAIAKWVDYRPGTIAPLLIVMFAIPAILFEHDVGRDELHYRILEHDFGPKSTVYFVDQDLTEDLHREAEKRWREHADPRPGFSSLMNNLRLAWKLEIDGAFTEHKGDVLAAYEWFVRQFPTSRYIPNALYLQGRAMDMRIDAEAFNQRLAVRHYDTFVSEQSRMIWTKLASNYPDSPLAAEAMYRLAVLDARAGNIDAAMAHLTQIEEKHLSDTAEPFAAAKRKTLTELLRKRPAIAGLAYDGPAVMLEARRLLELLRNNRDPLYGYKPITRWLQCDPRHPNYKENLDRIVTDYPRCLFEDNLFLERALAQRSNHMRIVDLERCGERYADGDAIAEISYRLGMEYLEEAMPQAAEQLQTVIRNWPESIWAAQATQRLNLQMPSRLPTTGL